MFDGFATEMPLSAPIDQTFPRLIFHLYAFYLEKQIEEAHLCRDFDYFAGCCEQSTNIQESTDVAVLNEAPEAHLGRCILLEPNRQAPGDLYQVGNVVATDEIAPFSKKAVGQWSDTCGARRYIG